MNSIKLSLKHARRLDQLFELCEEFMLETYPESKHGELIPLHKSFTDGNERSALIFRTDGITSFRANPWLTCSDTVCLCLHDEQIDDLCNLLLNTDRTVTASKEWICEEDANEEFDDYLEIVDIIRLSPC